MKEVNERFGVVDEEKRAMYEKEFQVPFGYDYITFDREEAIKHCKSLRTPSARSKKIIVERIYNTMEVQNKKEVIYRNN